MSIYCELLQEPIWIRYKSNNSWQCFRSTLSRHKPFLTPLNIHLFTQNTELPMCRLMVLSTICPERWSILLWCCLTLLTEKPWYMVSLIGRIHTVRGGPHAHHSTWRGYQYRRTLYKKYHQGDSLAYHCHGYIDTGEDTHHTLRTNLAPLWNIWSPHYGKEMIANWPDRDGIQVTWTSPSQPNRPPSEGNRKYSKCTPMIEVKTADLPYASESKLQDAKILKQVKYSYPTQELRRNLGALDMALQKPKNHHGFMQWRTLGVPASMILLDEHLQLWRQLA